jgi:hypothetical protein
VSRSLRGWRGVACAVLVGTTLLFINGCAPKSPDQAVWTDQARHAVADVRSDVDTLELVLRQQRSNKLPQNYQQVVAIDSEESIGTTASSFSSVQPPVGVDGRYKQVTSLLSDASDLAAETRIAIVREDTTEYPRLLRDLAKMSDDLSRMFAELNVK